MEEIEPTKMVSSIQDSVTWDDIELAESYLVCGMFEEAAESASSVLTRIHENKDLHDGDDVGDMLTSSAMVLIQSWRETGRTSDLLNELECYFGSTAEIPIQVVLTGACVQVSAGHPSGVRNFLDDFLAEWQLSNDKYVVCTSPNVEKTGMAAYATHASLEVDEYLEVVEFYTLTLLGGALHDVDHAVLWVEKAQLPEEARQDLMRRLMSLNPLKTTSSTQDAVSSSVVGDPESHPSSLKEVKQSDKSMMVVSSKDHSGVDGMKHSVWTLLRNITKRSYNCVAASNGKIMFGCLIFLIFYFIRKKREAVKSGVQRRALALKQALVDLWQLAFSYQVNPLAAVQPLPSSANRSR